jgi:O-antigen ligase
MISGQFAGAFRVPAFNFLLLFTVWAILCLPFAYSRRDSLQLLTEMWFRSIIVCLLACAAFRTVESCRKAMYTLAYAILVILVMGFFYGSYQNGRFVIIGGTLGNPNEVALRLAVGLPFCIYVFRNETGFSLKRLVMLLSFPAFLVIIGRTGSRAGIVALVALAMAMLLQAKMSQKVALLGVWTILSIAILSSLPRETMIRFRTFFTTEVDYTDEVAAQQATFAAGSTIARTRLLYDSVMLTLSHPVFGVGMGNFASVDARYNEERGRRASWHETHNTAAQLSTECGIPGMILYLCALGCCFKQTASTYRYAKRDPRLADLARMGSCLFMAVLCWTMGSLFDSEAYRFDFPMLAGVCGAFVVTAREEMRRRTAETVPAEQLMPESPGRLFTRRAATLKNRSNDPFGGPRIPA